MPVALCPECDAEVHIAADADKGNIISCTECGGDLELVGLDPFELDIVEENDYDDYEEEEESDEKYY